ncbi:hypothetical protein BC739_006352 [Kutzneria viridogrisea]|uniref:DUF4328 domain-containing protein n=2 Tax=Kutzneria TaxID=43356 RepID=W5VYF8_9PSEU|nr:DUF4328 domain-containing protein [Kutzneria albida]AHH93480.1 hypothetical protein KALB_103 [Kutzneria albida DSM 43870]MBA8929134.1 hypothetical protein [Kutzneria viridogrisea]
MHPQRQWEWVATPPPRALPQSGSRTGRFRRPSPYTGPPSYPAPPRWGFPRLSWRWPVSVPTGGSTAKPVDQLRMLARNAALTLWLTAATLGLAAVGEGWRFVLLLLSRDGALSREVLAYSDALVVTAGVVSAVSAVASALLALGWLLRARQVAATAADQVPARSRRQVLFGLLVPGLNLVLAGSILAELEHTAARQPASERPKPSRQLLWWWGAWALSQVLFLVTMLVLFLDGSVQGMANGVELHLLADLVAAFLAVASAQFIARITTLLEPVDLTTVHRLRVLRVTDSPAPPLRAVRAPGSVR